MILCKCKTLSLLIVHLLQDESTDDIIKTTKAPKTDSNQKK